MRIITKFAFYIALGFLVPATALALPVNGDFEDGLNAWTATSLVGVTNGGPPGNDVALLFNLSEAARLFQGVALPSGQYLIEFDFNFDPFLAGGGPDTFFASLYFTNDLSLFDIDNLVFDDVIALLDYDGTNIDAHGGTVTPSAFFNLPRIFHYAVPFSNNYSYVVPVFELLNHGSRGNFAFLDNVTISEAPVPEPATLLLMATGLFAFAVRKRMTLHA